MIERVIIEETLVHQQRLHGVTRGGVVGLGVNHDLDSLGKLKL